MCTETFYVRLGISNTQDLLAIVFFLLPCLYTIYRQILHFHVCNREKLSLHSCWVCLWCPAQPYSTAIPPTDMGTGRQCSALCLLLKGSVHADQCLRSLKTEENTLEISLFSPVWPDQLWHTGHLLLITRCSLEWGTIWLFILSTAQTRVMKGVLKPFWSRRPSYIANLHIRGSSKQASFHTTWLSNFFFLLENLYISQQHGWVIDSVSKLLHISPPPALLCLGCSCDKNYETIQVQFLCTSSASCSSSNAQPREVWRRLAMCTVILSRQEDMILFLKMAKGNGRS